MCVCVVQTGPFTLWGAGCHEPSSLHTVLTWWVRWPHLPATATLKRNWTEYWLLWAFTFRTRCRRPPGQRIYPYGDAVQGRISFMENSSIRQRSQCFCLTMVIDKKVVIFHSSWSIQLCLTKVTEKMATIFHRSWWIQLCGITTCYIHSSMTSSPLTSPSRGDPVWLMEP